MNRVEYPPIADKPPTVLTQKQKFEVYKATQSVKGAYCRLLALCKELDIPFPA